jgi:hypothetical protein
MAQRAIDLGGPMKEISRWIWNMNQTQPVEELIHWPLDGWQNLKHGSPLNFGGATNSQHEDHVHWSMANMVASDGKLVSMAGGGGGGGGGGGFRSGAAAIFDLFMKPFDAMVDSATSQFSTMGEFGQLPKNMYGKMKGSVREFIAGKDQSSGSSGSTSMGPLGAGAMGNAAQIVDSAKAHSLDALGASIGVATGLVESNLRVLANPAVPESLNMPNEGIGTDHDSVGIFQQRQSGWGSLAERMNPRASADMFFNKLVGFDWRSMDPGAAAQKVQVSAKPDEYGKRMGEAQGIVAQLFDKGGYIKPGLNIINNQSGVPEPVFSGGQWDVLKQGLNFGGANKWAEEQDFMSQFQNWGKDALKETVGQFAEPFGLSGTVESLIDQAVTSAIEEQKRQESANSSNVENGQQYGPSMIAETMIFNGMDPNKVIDEQNRALQQGMTPTGGRYRGGN